MKVEVTRSLGGFFFDTVKIKTNGGSFGGNSVY